MAEWDSMITSLLDIIPTSSAEQFAFKDEFQTMDFIDKQFKNSMIVCEWLSLRANKPVQLSENISQGNRDAGNKAFQLRQFDVAAAYYSEAILTAPRNSTELALAHANRASTCTQSHGFAEIGYHDCEFALRFNYPLEKRDKLLERKFRLASMLHNTQYMSDTLNDMEKLVQSGIFTDNHLNCSARRKQLVDNNRNEQTELLQADEPNVPESVFDEYLNLDTSPANLTYAKFKQKYNEQIGRFVIADETILKNQPIFREKAFAFVPVHHYQNDIERSFSCENCAKSNCLPFPCNVCCRAIYCTPKCMEQHSAIHEYECAGYKMNLWHTIGIAHLGFRTFIVGMLEALNILRKSPKMTARKIVDTLKAIKNENFIYAKVLNLVTNFEKMNANDCMSYAITAYMLSTYLDKFTSLKKEFMSIVNSPSEWDALSRMLIFTHIGQLVSNGHAITDFELRSPTQTNESYRSGCDKISARHLYAVVSSSRIFTAIFPRISMLNHSCDSNIRNIFDGPFLSIYACRDIMEGDEILNCYGPSYKLMPCSERDATLKYQYCFDCRCDKCTTNDEAWEKHYEFICCSEKCSDRPTVNVYYQHLWEHPHSKLVCHRCKSPCVTPQLISLSRMLDHEVAFDTDEMLLRWKNANCALGVYHEFRAEFAQGILRRSITGGLTHANIIEIARIAAENLLLADDRYGQFSIEFVMATTYVLAILEQVIRLEKLCNRSDHCENEKIIRELFNMKIIEKSYTILSPLMKKIFRTAIREVQHKVTCYR